MAATDKMKIIEYNSQIKTKGPTIMRGGYPVRVTGHHFCFQGTLNLSMC